MVNKTLLNYFRRYRGLYAVGDLKKKVLSKGYPLKEVNEVIALLGLNKRSPVVRTRVKIPGVALTKKFVKPFQKTKPIGGTLTKPVSNVTKPTSSLPPLAKPIFIETGSISSKLEEDVWGRKLMNVAGIIGIIFLFSFLIIFLLDFFLDPGLFYHIESLNPYIFFPILFILSLGMIFYYYGFIKLGEKIEAKSFRISVILKIVSTTLLIIIIILSLVLIGGIEDGALGESESLGTYNPVLMVLGIALLVIIVLGLSFPLSLLRFRDYLKFALAAGTFGLITSILFFISGVFFVYFIFYTSIMVSFLDSLDSNSIYLGFVIGSFIILQLSFLLKILFESLVLLSASKNIVQG